MKIMIFFKYLFKHFAPLVFLNISILIFTGLIDSAAILSLTPVVDILVNPSLQNISSITHRIVEIMRQLGISTTVINLLIIFIMFNVLRSFSMVLSLYYIQKTKYALIRNIVVGAFEDFFNARWSFFSSNKQGTLLNTFMREINIVGDAFGTMGAFFAQLLQCLVFLVVPFVISWQVSLISITAALMFAIPFTLFGKISYRLGFKSTNTANEGAVIIQESLQSAKVILGFGNQNKNLSLLRDAIDAHRRAAVRSITLTQSIRQLYMPLGIIVLAVSIISGQRFALPISELVVVLYSFFKIIPLIADLTAHKNALSNYYPSFEQVMGLRGRARILVQRTGATVFSRLERGISLEGLGFAYLDGLPVLTDITVRIPKGQMVAFVGHSGSGKSTLIDIIMGFNEPLAGRITVDDVPLGEYDINSYRQRIGYVPQDSILFNMSIRDNLRWAREYATDEEIMDACCQANALEFIEGSPHGFDTIVGDRGVRLSGGQIQRIALARAILRSPELLILDEATSSLDTESERLIQESIETISKKTTIIAIAHRLSTIKKASYIYVLDKGKIVEEGTYTELIEKDGLFTRMTKLQLLEQ